MEHLTTNGENIKYPNEKIINLPTTIKKIQTYSRKIYI